MFKKAELTRAEMNIARTMIKTRLAEKIRLLKSCVIRKLFTIKHLHGQEMNYIFERKQAAQKCRKCRKDKG